MPRKGPLLRRRGGVRGSCGHAFTVPKTWLLIPLVRVTHCAGARCRSGAVYMQELLPMVLSPKAKAFDPTVKPDHLHVMTKCLIHAAKVQTERPQCSHIKAVRGHQHIQSEAKVQMKCGRGDTGNRYFLLDWSRCYGQSRYRLDRVGIRPLPLSRRSGRFLAPRTHFATGTGLEPITSGFGGHRSTN